MVCNSTKSVQHADIRSRTPCEQKKLLDKAESRSILEQAEDDTTSLVAVDNSPSTLVARRAWSVLLRVINRYGSGIEGGPE